MLVPVVRELAKSYPSLWIDVLSKRYTEGLFADLGENVHFIGSVDEVNRKAYDMVADMHSVLRSRKLSIELALRGAKVRHIRKGRMGKWLLVHGKEKKQQRTTIERYVDVLERLGLPIPMPKAHIGGGERHDIGVAPFAAHAGKIYPLAQMEQVVAGLAADGAAAIGGERILLFGAGEKEMAILHEWEKKYDHVESMAGKMKMAEEVRQMGSLRLMLTMDSGNMHLASLAGTRVLSIWGATHTKAGFLGWGQKTSDCIERSLDCRPCSVYGNKACKWGDYRCLAIAPEEIVERVKEAICE